MKRERQYIAIDLKSFYASVECNERGLDPLTTNLVVADASRTDKTISLAVSPSLKAYGIGGRARLFEVIQRLRQVNEDRQFHAPGYRFSGKSTDDNELKNHPELAVDYIAAPPRMAYYIQYSTRIYQIYLRYIAPEDIHVYSIDEVFIDATNYLKTYKMTAHQLAMTMIREVLRETGITATAGIGTNLYLAKVAMDIVAKHIPADSDGVRIAELNEMSYRQQLWNHRPLTDFWRIGPGIARRLERNEIYTMGMLARQSVVNDEKLYKMFGVNAELIIDHAWGWEPVTIDYIKRYRPETNSFSSSQVLQSPYAVQKARIVVQEMADAVALHLVERRLVCHQLALTVNYDTESLADPTVRAAYTGEITIDHYGRPVPKYAHGTFTLAAPSSSARLIIDAILSIYDRTVNPLLLVRRLTIATLNVIHQNDIAETTQLNNQLDLFIDYDEQQQQEQQKTEEFEKERRMQEAVISIKRRFGKNAILKGLNFQEGATAKDRNRQIGGHKA
ncbi:MAG: DNA methylase [Bacteroidales bacterium]|nr:DNA methylase [Bacteroidales bacterium]